MMNGWVSFPMHESSLKHDLAIRRFCPARLVEQQQLGEYFDDQEETNFINIDEIDHHQLQFPPHDTIANIITTPCLSPSEEEQFVHSFFSVDSYDHNNQNDSPPVPDPDHHNQLEALDCNYYFPDHDHELPNFSMADHDVYGDHHINDPLMMIEGEYHDHDNNQMEIYGCSFLDDFGGAAVSEEKMMVFSTSKSPNNMSSIHGVDQGLQLVHLLLACAEAVGCRDTQLANSILSQVWASVSPWGDSLQRVSYCFAVGLKCRLFLLLHNVNPNGTFTFVNGTAKDDEVSQVTREEKTEAFQLLHQTTPYLSFGFTAANDAICQAAQGKDLLHIIDLGMEVHTLLQWPSLIRTLASRPEGPPKMLRITGIVEDHHLQNDISKLEAIMKGLIDEAHSLGIPLEFETIPEPENCHKIPYITRTLWIQLSPLLI